MAQHKILYCASTAGHLLQFHLPYLRQLQSKGYHITACVNEYADIPYVDEIAVIPFQKKITSFENIKNILRVYHLLREQQFSAVSVHTALASAVVRAAILLLPASQRPKVFCTCHGYLFGNEDGAGKWKYLLPERLCADVTDVLMVMNQEDYVLAETYHLCKNKKSPIFIPGMGVPFHQFDITESKAQLRQRYGIGQEEVLFLFAGEFSERKNQQTLIRAFARASGQMPNARLILAGSGALLEYCRQFAAEQNLQHCVLFTGQIKHMPQLYHLSDICVSASKTEGLPFNIMEAMYCQLPCIASNVKGHRDLIAHGQTGYLFDDELQLSLQMVHLYRDTTLRQQIGAQAKQAVLQYDLSAVQSQIMKVYEEHL